jgi:hypothetical protein
MGISGAPVRRPAPSRSIAYRALGALVLSSAVSGCSVQKVDRPPADPAPPADEMSAPAANTPANTPGNTAADTPATDMGGSSVPDTDSAALTSVVQPLGDGAACLSESRDMDLRPLALYLMLDSSGSMQEPSGSSATKWEAVQRALRAFLAETQEGDLLLGMQFFPLLKPGSKFVCTTNEDCGPDGGPCFLSTCLQGDVITLCESDADCGSMPDTNPCVKFGLCQNGDPAAPTACVLPSTCGGELGACMDFERTCTNATSCDPAAYAAPAVEIQSASAGLGAIDQALLARDPGGLTPTVPALQGALDHARAWAQAHPNQTVAILLATDGLPTDCVDTPAGAPAPQPAPTAATAIDQVEQIAAAGAADGNPIPTYVIGVFQPGEGASASNVNAIAQAGGTGQAALIDASGQVEDTFLAALRGVRDTAAPCQLRLTAAQGLDFTRADLLFDTGTGSPSSLPNVDGLLGCASKPDAWYYDVPPAQGTPSAVQLCPNLCQVVKSSSAAGLTLQIGCAGP